MISRYYENLEQRLKPGKVLLIFGPRQVGKTTLLQNFLGSTKYKYLFESGDNVFLQQSLGSWNFEEIAAYVRGYDLIVIDEAQRIPNIGQALKIMVDQHPKLRVIATGSASFELAGQVGEPLTGRQRTITLYPLSQLELSKYYNNTYELRQALPQLLVTGTYPEVLNVKSHEERVEAIQHLVNSYLLKDILELENIKSSKTLINLLRLLAFQIGSEVSHYELGTQLMLDAKTVARYLDLLEKSFILYNVRGYSRNLRKEVTKKSKYYFLDLGVRNILASNPNPLELRNDVGQLWENFLVIERLKTQSYKNILSNNYFWRTWDQKEIDWVEEREGKLLGYEFKWSPTAKRKSTQEFLDTYKHASIQTVNRDNYLQFLEVPGAMYDGSNS